MEALFTRASKLPLVELIPPREGNVIGKNTVESMQAGIIFGFVGQIDGLVERMRAELGGSCRVIATGGLAALVNAHSRSIELVDENLTLDGLRLLFELNQGDA
jgi:type III pantothenate kinase